MGVHIIVWAVCVYRLLCRGIRLADGCFNRLAVLPFCFFLDSVPAGLPSHHNLPAWTHSGGGGAAVLRHPGVPRAAVLLLLSLS
jgi:hypothetical protein